MGLGSIAIVLKPILLALNEVAPMFAPQSIKFIIEILLQISKNNLSKRLALNLLI